MRKRNDLIPHKFLMNHGAESDVGEPVLGDSSTFSVAPLLLKASELAELLGVSTRTLWRLRSSGHLPPAVKVGGSTRWRREDITRWISEGCPTQDSIEQ